MPPLTVATINLRNRIDRWLERRHLLVDQITAVSPDLISLQEVSFPIRQGGWLRDQINLRLSTTRKEPYRLVLQRKKHLYHGYFEGIGILTKLPILYKDALSLGYNGRVALRLNVELPTRQTADFVAVHLHHPAVAKQARQEQVMKLVGWLNGRRRVPWQIIAGDFNETPTGPAIQTMKQSYRSLFEEKHAYEPVATFPTALVQRPDDWSGCLDYIFLSKAVNPVVDAQIFCNRSAENDDMLYPSDHVGILGAISL
ncbi:MAG: endonuclease/exonuclease/phosphatase family protein [Chloroflexota bacterium]